MEARSVLLKKPYSQSDRQTSLERHNIHAALRGQENTAPEPIRLARTKGQESRSAPYSQQNGSLKNTLRQSPQFCYFTEA